MGEDWGCDPDPQRWPIGCATGLTRRTACRCAWTEVLEWQLAHRSVRSYRPDPVSDETLTALIAAAQSAPTSGNLQLWSVVAVRDDERRTRLAELAGEQDFIDRGAVAAGLAGRSRSRAAGGRADRSGDRRRVRTSSRRRCSSFVDVALAAQNASLAAESLGLGTVFVGAIRNRPLEVAAELGAACATSSRSSG